MLFPKLVRRARELMPYAKKQAQMRDQADPGRPNMYSYIAKAKGNDADPSYKDDKEVFAEARGLIVGGTCSLNLGLGNPTTPADKMHLSQPRTQLLLNWPPTSSILPTTRKL